MSKQQNEIKRVIAELRERTEHPNNIITELMIRTAENRMDTAENLIKILKRESFLSKSKGKERERGNDYR